MYYNCNCPTMNMTKKKLTADSLFKWTVSQGSCCIRLVHYVPKGPYLISTLLPPSQDVLFSLCWVSFATFPYRATTHHQLGSGKTLMKPFMKTKCVICSVFLRHMKALLKKKDNKISIALKGVTEKPSGDMMHQKWPNPHPNVTARMKISFSSVFSALELFFLSTLAHWVKCKLPL